MVWAPSGDHTIGFQVYMELQPRSAVEYPLAMENLRRSLIMNSPACRGLGCRHGKSLWKRLIFFAGDGPLIGLPVEAMMGLGVFDPACAGACRAIRNRPSGGGLGGGRRFVDAGLRTAFGALNPGQPLLPLRGGIAFSSFFALG